jgi:hypothetical protein
LERRWGGLGTVVAVGTISVDLDPLGQLTLLETVGTALTPTGPPAAYKIELQSAAFEGLKLQGAVSKRRDQGVWDVQVVLEGSTLKLDVVNALQGPTSSRSRSYTLEVSFRAFAPTSLPRCEATSPVFSVAW